MTNAELNTALYEKMFAEQEQYKDWLLTQPPAKILDCSYEYTVRENFLMSLEYNSLTNDQAAALLVCPDVLKDLFHQYEKMGNSQMEEVWACFENRAEQVQAVQGQAKESLYWHSSARRREHGEPAPYRNPDQINAQCKEAIEAAIGAHYKENRLDAKAAAQEVLDKFGPERVQTVLAATVQDKDWDVRISGENKAWAQTVPMPEGSEGGNWRSYWVVDSHPGLVNLFVDQVRDMVRERENEKPSVIQQLRQEPTAGKTKAAPPKKREPER